MVAGGEGIKNDRKQNTLASLVLTIVKGYINKGEKSRIHILAFFKFNQSFGLIACTFEETYKEKVGSFTIGFL